MSFHRSKVIISNLKSRNLHMTQTPRTLNPVYLSSAIEAYKPVGHMSMLLSNPQTPNAPKAPKASQKKMGVWG